MVQGNFTLPADCRDLTKPENNSAEWLQRVPAKAGDCIIMPLRLNHVSSSVLASHRLAP